MLAVQCSAVPARQAGPSGLGSRRGPRWTPGEARRILFPNTIPCPAGRPCCIDIEGRITGLARECVAVQGAAAACISHAAAQWQCERRLQGRQPALPAAQARAAGSLSSSPRALGLASVFRCCLAPV